MSRVDGDWLLARAQGLITQGDISGARLLLEHALQAGNHRAAFLLAETYDPQILASWRALGLKGDPKRARELYTRAAAGGIAASDERLRGLE
jgi:TPR repeat protein